MIGNPLLDTLHINFIDELDHSILNESRKPLPTYQYYKKICEFFKFFDIDPKVFDLQRLSQKFKRQFSNGIYVEIKTFSLKSQASVPEIKICSIQFKGLFFLKIGYAKLQKFLSLYSALFNMTVSKIEIALDIKADFSFETMKLALKYRANFIKIKNAKFIFNFTNKSYESINVENTFNTLKVYNKTQELDLKYNFEKKNLYKLKNKISDTDLITRIEIGLKTKQQINQKTISDIINMPELEYCLDIFKDYFKKVEILKKSHLKSAVIKTLKFKI